MGCAEKVVLAYSGRIDTSVCIAEFKADEKIDWMTHAIAYTPHRSQNLLKLALTKAFSPQLTLHPQSCGAKSSTQAIGCNFWY
jgi:hypothetical protein